MIQGINNHFSFEGTTQEVIDHVRWCRNNLGELGVDWEFASSRLGKKIDVWIVHNKTATWYTLKFANARSLSR